MVVIEHFSTAPFCIASLLVGVCRDHFIFFADADANADSYLPLVAETDTNAESYLLLVADADADADANADSTLYNYGISVFNIKVIKL